MKITSEASYVLNLIRALAAQAVVIGHISSYLFAQIYIAQIAVVVFFVLSGYLVAFSAQSIKNRGDGFKEFFIRRFVRIFTPFIPVLILIAVVDVTIVKMNIIPEYRFAPQVTMEEFFGNLFMLQNRPVIGSVGRQLIFDVNQFGSGRPLWTISFEWCLYMSFGIAFFLYARLREPKIILAFIVSASVPFFNAWSVSSYCDGLVWIWLLGACLMFLTMWNAWAKVSFKAIALFGVGAFTVACADAFGNIYKFGKLDAYNLNFMILVLLPIAAAIVAAQIYPNRIRPFVFSSPAVTVAADYSYSLYLIHYTVVSVFYYTMKGYNDVLVAVLMFMTANLVAFAIAYFTEFRRGTYIRWLTHLLSRNPSRSSNS